MSKEATTICGTLHYMAPEIIIIKDWRKRRKAPYKPTISAQDDVKNFSTESTDQLPEDPECEAPPSRIRLFRGYTYNCNIEYSNPRQQQTKSTEDEGITLVNDPVEATLANGPASAATATASDEEDLVLHERFDPDLDSLPVFYGFDENAPPLRLQVFYGFDENAPPLRLPEEYYVELPLPLPLASQEERLEMPPPPAPTAPVTAVTEAPTNRRPRTRQQRRTETLQRANSLGETPPEVDSKAGLYLLMRTLPPPAEIVVARLPRVQRTARTLPIPVGRSKRVEDEENLFGFTKTPTSWRKSRASYRHLCLLLNGVQQVLKHRFKKERRVYALPTVKIEKNDEGYEKALIFPRPKQRQPRAPKVYRPPTRVLPERALRHTP